MCCLVNVGHNGMAMHLTRNDCEAFLETLYIQCSGWGWWWYVLECQWRGWEC